MLIHTLTEDARCHARLAVAAFDKAMAHINVGNKIMYGMALESQAYHHGAIAGLYECLYRLGAEVPDSLSRWTTELEEQVRTGKRESRAE